MLIPREKIPWYPTIDYDKCIGCLTCVNFDKETGHNVYDVEGNPPRPVVRNPYSCVVGCRACATLCPANAIKFPSMKELREALRKLRLEY